MVANLLEVEALPEKTRNLILQKSEGNPFFVEEVIRQLIESGHLEQTATGWRATGKEIDIEAILKDMSSLGMKTLPGSI